MRGGREGGGGYPHHSHCGPCITINNFITHTHSLPLLSFLANYRHMVMVAHPLLLLQLMHGWAVFHCNHISLYTGKRQGCVSAQMCVCATGKYDHHNHHNNNKSHREWRGTNGHIWTIIQIILPMIIMVWGRMRMRRREKENV